MPPIKRGTPAYKAFRASRAPNPPVKGRFRRDTTDLEGRPQPPGGFSYGTQLYGGPLFTDSFDSRKAPSPWQLVENWIALPYAMVTRKRDGVAKTPLRLYCDGSRRILGGRPRHVCDPIKVSRNVAVRHARTISRVSPSAVDEIYEVRNHPFLDVLDNPDPYGYFNRESLIGLMVCYMDVVGQGFIVPEGNGWDWTGQKIREKKGPPEYLWVIYSQFVIPFRDAGSNLVRFWQYFQDQIPFESCIWFRNNLSLRDPYGSVYSPLYAGTTYQEQEQRFISIYDQLYALGPRPSLIATAKDPTNPPGEPQRRRFEQDLLRRQAAGNAGGILVNDGAWEFREMNYSPTDMGGKELAEYDRTCLATVMGVPPSYFTTETNLANLEAADAYFARFGVEPMCKSIAATLTRVVRQMDPRLYFAFDPVLAEDEEKMARVDKIYVDMGARTLNEVNEEKRYPSKPWGDVPYVSKNLVPIDRLGALVDQSLSAQQAKMDHDRKMLEFQTSGDTPLDEAESYDASDMAGASDGHDGAGDDEERDDAAAGKSVAAGGIEDGGNIKGNGGIKVAKSAKIKPKPSSGDTAGDAELARTLAAEAALMAVLDLT